MEEEERMQSDGMDESCRLLMVLKIANVLTPQELTRTYRDLKLNDLYSVVKKL